MFIQLLSPEESVEIVKRLNEEKRGDPRQLNLIGGVSIKGSADIICREAETGEVVWKDSVDNAITDYCRQLWMDNLMYTSQISFSANTEPVDFRRMTFVGPCAANDIVDSGFFARTLAGLTASWPFTFSTLPTSNRTIGTIALGGRSESIGMYVYAALLLSPPKTQTTTQTLEVIYKLTASAIA